jgi:hypothetical protein
MAIIGHVNLTDGDVSQQQLHYSHRCSSTPSVHSDRAIGMMRAPTRLARFSVM